ncbi:thialysine N-epsilon-acetyltransferase-like isoform X3 [Haliotis asinina]|uniref:thialysine N-epsilon-acetyltransferase-like isoform X3 n=1 Tax=Haliotis asinina TaxID=109174 RepID=UPI0035327D31
MAELTYRHAVKDDCDEILRLVKELAEFENLLDQVNITSENTSKLIGYLLYFWSYGTFTGRVLYVEDLYVSQNHRRRGVASALWDFAMKIALEKGCKRMQWVVLDWNTTAVAFYEKLGAVNLSKKEGWLIYRLNEDDIRAAITG